MKFDLEALVLIGGIALLFGGLSFLNVPDLRGFAYGGLFGAYIGFAALPIFDDEKWKPRPFMCSVLGGVGAMVAAFERFGTPSAALIGGVAGLSLGYIAPRWAKHL